MSVVKRVIRWTGIVVGLIGFVFIELAVAPPLEWWERVSGLAMAATMLYLSVVVVFESV